MHNTCYTNTNTNDNTITIANRAAMRYMWSEGTKIAWHGMAWDGMVTFIDRSALDRGI